MSRKGISALYGFTPFQLRSTEPYEILLPPISYLRTNPHRNAGNNPYRSSGTRDKYEVPLEAFDKDVVQPMSLNYTQFDQSSDNKIVYERNSLESNSTWTYPPVHMEFSYEALSSTNCCRKAFVTASSEEMCPVRHQCPHQENPNADGGCSHYRKNERFDRLYKIYPNVVQHYADSSGGDPDRVGAVKYGEKPLFSVGIADKGEFRAYIDEVSINSQPDYMWNSSVFLQEGIGFRTRQVSGLEFDFQSDVFSDLTLDVIESSSKVEEWLALKYILYQEDENQVDRKNGFSAFDKLEEGALNGLKGDPNLGTRARDIDFAENESAREFAEVTLLHSLAHLLRDRLCMRFGAEKEHLGYYMEHPASDVQTSTSDKTRIVIFETAIGGFGYVAEFANQLEENGMSSLETLIEPVVNFLSDHEDTVQQRFDSIRSRDFDEEHAHAGLMARAFTGLDSEYIYPHAKSVRRAVYNYLSDIEPEDDLTETVLDQVSDDPNNEDLNIGGDDSRNSIRDILRDAPLCWDGCQHCVEETRECSFLTFDRPFVSSRSLVKGALREILENIRSPTESSSAALARDELIREYFIFAREEVLIEIQNIDNRFVDVIKEELLEFDIPTKLVIAQDSSDGDRDELLMELDNLEESTSLTISEGTEVEENSILIDGICLLQGDLVQSNPDVRFDSTLEVDFTRGSCSDFREGFSQE